MTQEAVADAVGVKRPTVSSWENNKDKPGRDSLAALATLYGITIDDLLKESAEAASASELAKAIIAGPPAAPLPTVPVKRDFELARIAEPYFRQMPQNVPVLGVGAGSPVGEYMLNGEISEYVRRPVGIASASQVFAIWITGVSMFPRFDEGELAYVHPGRRPRIGDDVLIELRVTADGNRPAFIKRLVKLSDAEVVVEQFNPPQQIAYARAAVESVFKVLTLAELMGVG